MTLRVFSSKVSQTDSVAYKTLEKVWPATFHRNDRVPWRGTITSGAIAATTNAATLRGLL